MSTRGKWKVSVVTSSLPSAGTTSKVYIILYGLQGNSGPLFLLGREGDLFQSGHEDIFDINVGNIGELFKIRIGHNSSGQSPGWHCEETQNAGSTLYGISEQKECHQLELEMIETQWRQETVKLGQCIHRACAAVVRLQNLFTEEMFYLPVNRWLSQEEEKGGEICREVPVLHHGYPVFPVTLYGVSVVTGDLWNAGTGANVYINVYGENGDTGSRQLLNSKKPTKFCKGQVDTFTLEAVHLGHLEKVVIGHDGLGEGSGWFLEKVVLTDSLKDVEYTFLCNRWLDQGEMDGKIVTELYVSDGLNYSTRQELEHKRMEIWAVERWKFQKGNIVQLFCKLTGKCVRLHPDGTVDALGDKRDKQGFFDMTLKRGNIRVFRSLPHQQLTLAVDKGRVTALKNGGSLCELQVQIHPNRCVSLESVQIPGYSVTFDTEGHPADGATGYSGLCKEFVVHVKGILREGAVVMLNSSVSQALCITRDGQCVGTGRQAEESYFRVHKVCPGVYMFQSLHCPDMYLQVKGGQCNGRGTGDCYSHFKVEKNYQNGSLSLESVKCSGMFLGLLPDGSAKPLVHTGDSNVMFYPQVIKYGREKPTGTSATPIRITPVTPIPRKSPAPFKKVKTKRLEPLVSSGDEWTVSVVTGYSGTQAQVSLWIYGSEGNAGPILLEKSNRDTLFSPKQEDEFQIAMTNIGEIYKIRIGHDGTSDHPDWNLHSVSLRKNKDGQILQFRVNRWLSRNHGNGDILCEVPAMKEDGQPIFSVVKYQVTIYTGHLNHAETQSPVLICLYGERGDSGLRLLHKAQLANMFQRGQVDVFELEAVSLGKLQKVLLCCEAKNKSDYWYCEKVIIREPVGGSEYIFNCERWIPFSSEGVVKTGIELQVQEIRISVQHNEKEMAHDGGWKVTVVTGDFDSASTEATVYLHAYGEKGESGPIILGSGKHQLFNQNSADTFQVDFGCIGELYKLRIGHDNSGEDPKWYLEEVILHELATGKEFALRVDQWLAGENEDGHVWKEVPVPLIGGDSLPVVVYQVQVHTGSKPGAETDASVYINIFGTRGNTGKRKLYQSLNHKLKFQQGQVDIFNIEAVSLEKLRKVVIGHNGTGPGDGWFLEKVIIKAEEEDKHESVFLCNSWLDVYQDDGKIERELFVEGYEEIKKESQKGVWKVFVKTSDDSPVPKEMKVSIVIYGSEGKSDDIVLLPNNPGTVCFLPGARDEFLVDAGDVGKVYKIRVSCDGLLGFQNWHLKSIQIEEQHTGTELHFDCNCWLSPSSEHTEPVKEFPVVIEGRPSLRVNEYVVSVHTGDNWGAETYSNVYLTLYGEQGDSGARKLRHSLVKGPPFQQNKVDAFLLESVSLGRLTRAVLGHDGEGYGAGLYPKMVTVQESKTSRMEWVFPCFRWLDDHIGDQSTVCSLKSIGARSVVSQKLQEHSGTWTFEICGSDIKHNEGSIWVTLIVCGDKGHKKVRLHVTGPTLQIKEQIPEVGMIYKVCVSSKPDQVQQTWRLKTIDMKNLESKLEMHLNFDCLFVTNTHNYVELPALFPDQDPDPVVEYRINVYTGDVRNAGFTGEVYISLHGDRGNTGKWWLSKSQNTPNTFCRGQVDVFKITAVNLGQMKELVIGHKSQRKALMDCTDRWFLEKVIVVEGDMPTTQHTFTHNDWIDAHPKKPDVYEVVMPVKGTVEIRSNPIKEPEAGKARHWNMWVKCSPVPERPIDVSVIIFGEKGKSPLLRAENFHDKPFPVHTGEIGDILKVSFVSKSREKIKGLKLEKLRMKDSVTKQELGFDTTDRWLFEEKRLESVTELAAVRPDRPPLRDLIYSVKVHTGDLPAAATDAHISIALFGENGDTGVRRLTDSASRILLDKGKINVFCLRAVELGLPSKLTVEHSNEGYGAGCYLDRITVQASADTDAEFVFPCQQWLDSGTGDRWTKREIKLLGKVSSHSRMTADPQGTWDIHVLTGASSSIAVDSEVILEVCGERGMCSSLTLPGNKLRPGQIFQTVTEIDRKNGTILKIRLQTIEAREGGVWYCKEIKLQNRNTNEKIEFPVLRYLGDKEENLVLELPVIRKDSDLLKVKDYTVIVTSGPASEYETEPDVFVTLWGSLGDTGKRRLPRRRGSSHFNKEKVYVFQVEAVDIGLLEEVEVEKGRGSDWYLKQIVVKEGVYVEKEAVCVTKTWLNNRKRHLKLPLNDFQVNTIMPLTGLGEKEMKSDGLWCVYPITPLEEKDKSPSLFSCLVMILYGSKGKSKPLSWKPKESHSIEDPTVYEIELQEDLGEIYKVRLGLNSSTNKTAQVSICPFRMQNADTLDSFICCVNETLPLSSSGDRWLEVPVEWPLKPSLRVAVYHTTLFSSDFYKIRQPPQVALCVYGDHGDTGERPLLWPLHTQDQKDGTKAFTFEIEAVELGDLSKIVLTVSSKMMYETFENVTMNIFTQQSVSVHVDEIHLRDKADKEKLYVFNVNEEFNVGPDQETSVKEIKLSSVTSKGQRKVTPVKERVNSHEDDKDDEAEFLVITFTGDVAGAGTNARVHIVLFGNQGSSESIPLSATEEKWDPFEKGQVDTFKVKTRSVGTLHKIEIGHDGRGLESGWFLEKVEIIHPQSNLKLVFPCNRWLSANEGDRKTTVQLHCEGF